MKLYVYGLVPSSRAPDRRLNVYGHRIELLRIARIGVAVEALDEPPSMTEHALRTQHAVVARLAKRFDAVLPARFGSYLPLDELERIVSLRRADLREGLRSVRRRVQMTVRIVAPPSAAAVNREAHAAQSGTAYLKARRAATSGPLPPAAAILTRAVHPLLHDERVETDREHGRTALFHLVNRKDVKRYRSAIARAAVSGAEQVIVTGPFAPFAFAAELWRVS
jgi:hypothetical protein